MTYQEFVAICVEYDIDPDAALESFALVRALHDRDSETIKKIVESTNSKYLAAQ